MNDKLRAALAALALAGLAAGAFAQDGPQSLPKVRLNAGMHNIDAMLAQTPEQREIGLMFRGDDAQPTRACCSPSSGRPSSASG